MSRYLVTIRLGERRFARENDATDYQIKIISQVGAQSEVFDTYEYCESCGDKCGATLPYGSDCLAKSKEMK
jgi:hypothetical protein